MYLLSTLLFYVVFRFSIIYTFCGCLSSSIVIVTVYAHSLDGPLCMFDDEVHYKVHAATISVVG